MNSQNLYRIQKVIVAMLVLAMLVINEVYATGDDPVLASDGKRTTYLPLISSSYPRQMTGFGAQVHAWYGSGNVQLAVGAGLYWVRISAFDWDQIEPTNTSPDQYVWSAVNSAILQAGSNGMVTIATVRYAPAWALKDKRWACGPIREDAFDDFAEFMRAIVKRYSAPPYSIKYWELGNEPDIDRWAFAPGERPEYGCWGNASDPYYGGEYYAKMLAAVYPAIKRADPAAQVLVGGLMLDCDPTHPPEGRQDGCRSARFFEGILHGGGGPYFDIVSFHGYPPYTGSLKWDEQFPGWEARGGVVMGKIDYLHEVMSAYGVDKPLIHSESSLVCPEWESLCSPPGAAFYEAQADYVARLFVRNWAEGVMGTVWYTFDSVYWRNSGLLDEHQQPKPAYHALKFLTKELQGATYTGEVTQYEGVSAYEFRENSRRVWVMWAPDEVERAVQLPGNTVQVYDKYGNALAHANNQVAVKSPIFVELAP